MISIQIFTDHKDVHCISLTSLTIPINTFPNKMCTWENELSWYTVKQI